MGKVVQLAGSEGLPHSFYPLEILFKKYWIIEET